MPFSSLRRQILFASGAIAMAGSAQAAEPMRIAWPARKATPPVRLPRLEGDAWALEQPPGHAVLLNFWASWCAPCVAEMPSLARLAEREKSSGLQVVAVNYREPVDTIHRFLDARPVALDVALDRDGAAAKTFDVHVFPSTVALGAEGRVRFTVVGECDWEDAGSRRWLDELLARRG